MAYEAYISIKGNKQGQFKGEGIQDKRKDKWIEVLAFEYSVQAPRDIATGQASGKRQHKPVVITKEWGAASPQLLQALTTNETLSSVEFQFSKTNEEGEEQVYYTVKLSNARILSLRPYVGPPPPDSLRGERYESVTLDYADEVVTGSGGALTYPGSVKRFGKWA